MLVTDRIAPLRVAGPAVHQVGAAVPLGRARATHAATSANDLLALALDPNVHIQESKAATCDIRPGRRPRGAALLELVAGVPRTGRARRDGVALETRTTLLGWPGATPARPAAARWASSPTRPVHRLQGVRGRLQGVEPGPRRRARSPAIATTTPARSAPTRWRHVAFIEQRDQASCEQRATAGATGDFRWLMASRRVQALHPRRLPRRLPDRRAVPHRVRHRRRPAGRLQRLRLLRARVPVRRDRPARGRTAGSWKCTLCYDRLKDGDGAGLRAGVPDRLDPVRRARRAARARRSGASRRCTRRASPRRALYGDDPDDGVGGSARSSCCSTSPRSTGCRPTRSSRPATCRDLARGGVAAGAVLAGVVGGRRRRAPVSRTASDAPRAADLLLRPADHQAAGLEAGDPLLLLRRRHSRAPSAASALAARLSGRGAGAARLAARAAGVGVSPALLIADLGRPERFLNMLRMFKVTSPMSVGSWVLAVSGRDERRRRAARAGGSRGRRGPPSRVGGAALGPPLSTYTAALLADTAVPVWHEARRELPFVFAASSAASAGGAAPRCPAAPAAPRRRRLAGAAPELAPLCSWSAGSVPGRALQRGGAGSYWTPPPRGLTAAGAVVLAGGARRRPARSRAGALLLGGAVAERFAMFRAGLQSARDPRYTVVPQRQRVEQRPRRPHETPPVRALGRSSKPPGRRGRPSDLEGLERAAAAVASEQTSSRPMIERDPSSRDGVREEGRWGAGSWPWLSQIGAGCT